MGDGTFDGTSNWTGHWWVFISGQGLAMGILVDHHCGMYPFRSYN